MLNGQVMKMDYHLDPESEALRLLEIRPMESTGKIW